MHISRCIATPFGEADWLEPSSERRETRCSSMILSSAGRVPPMGRGGRDGWGGTWGQAYARNASTRESIVSVAAICLTREKPAPSSHPPISSKV